MLFVFFSKKNIISIKIQYSIEYLIFSNSVLKAVRIKARFSNLASLTVTGTRRRRNLSKFQAVVNDSRGGYPVRSQKRATLNGAVDTSAIDSEVI